MENNHIASDNTESVIETSNVDVSSNGSDNGSEETGAWSEDFDTSEMNITEPPVTPEDAPEDVKADKDEPLDLESLYAAQMSNKDASLENPILIKMNGKVVEVDNINDLKDMAERSLGATKKYQEMAEDRKVIEFMKSNNISMEALNQLIVSRGEVPVETVSHTEKDIQVQQVVDKISSSAYADDFRNGVSFLPDNVKSELANSPELLDGLYGDFESGLAQKVMPLVEKSMSIRNMNFVDAYVEAVQSLDNKPVNNPLTAEPRGNTFGIKAEPKKDIWALSSEEFRKYM